MKKRYVRLMALFLTCAVTASSGILPAQAMDHTSVSMEESVSGTDASENVQENIQTDEADSSPLTYYTYGLDSKQTQADLIKEGLVHTEKEQNDAKEKLSKALQEGGMKWEDTMDALLGPMDMFAIFSDFTPEEWKTFFSSMEDCERKALSKIVPYTLLSYANYAATLPDGKEEALLKAVEDYGRILEEGHKIEMSHEADELAYHYLVKANGESYGADNLSEYAALVKGMDKGLKEVLETLENLPFHEDGTLGEESFDTAAFAVFGWANLSLDSKEEDPVSETAKEDAFGKNDLKPEDETQENQGKAKTGSEAASGEETLPETDKKEAPNSTDDTMKEADASKEVRLTAPSALRYYEEDTVRYIDGFADLDLTENSKVKEVTVKESELSNIPSSFPESITVTDANGEMDTIPVNWVSDENPLLTGELRYEVALPDGYAYTSSLKEKLSTREAQLPYIIVHVTKDSILDKIKPLIGSKDDAQGKVLDVNYEIEDDEVLLYLNAKGVEDPVKAKTGETDINLQEGIWVVDGKVYNYQGSVDQNSLAFEEGNVEVAFYQENEMTRVQQALTDTKGVSAVIPVQLDKPSVNRQDILPISKDKVAIYLNVENPGSVEKLYLPTWNEEGGQDDLSWEEGTFGEYAVSGRSYNYRCILNVGDHGVGTYRSDIYVNWEGGASSLGGFQYSVTEGETLYKGKGIEVALFEDGTLTIALSKGKSSVDPDQLIPAKYKERIRRVRLYQEGESEAYLTSCDSLFAGAVNLESIDTGVFFSALFQRVTSYSHLFEGCKNLCSLPADFHLNEGVSDTSYLFAGSGLKEYPLSMELTKYKDTLKKVYGMFDGTPLLSDFDETSDASGIAEESINWYLEKTGQKRSSSKSAATMKKQAKAALGVISFDWQNGEPVQKYTYYDTNVPFPNDTATTIAEDVTYRGGQSYVGWMADTFQNGQTMGDTSHYLEMFSVASPVSDSEMSIKGRAFNNKSGWSSWVKEGGTIGVEASSNRMTGIQLDLEGTYADLYEIQYRVYTDAKGWEQWKSNGQTAGLSTNSNSGGNHIKMLEIRLVKNENAKNPGKTFTGWYTDKECTQKVTSLAPGQTGDLTLYAGWKGNTYALQYELDGGTNNSQNPTSFVSGESFTVSNLKAPTRTGWEFGGWYTDANFQNQFTKIPSDQAAPFTLYAEWINPVSYKITYSLGGGTNDSRNPTTYHSGEPIKLESPVRNGYSFKGWYKDSSLTQKVTAVGENGMYGNVTLYASWEAVTKATITKVVLEGESDGVTNIYAKVENLPSGSKVMAPTWTQEDGQDDIIWGQMTKGSWTINGTVMNYKYTVKKSDHFNDYGPYNTHFYEQKSNGSRVALNGFQEGYMLYAGDGFKVSDKGDNCYTWTCTMPTKEYTTATSFTPKGITGITYGPTWCADCNYEVRHYITVKEYYTKCSHLGTVIRFKKSHYKCSRNGGVVYDYDGKGGRLPYIPWASSLIGRIVPASYSHNYKVCSDHRVGNSYQVYFHSNGGSGTMPGQSMTYGKSASLYANQFTKPGYVFAGWTTDRNGTTVEYEDGELVYNLAKEDGSVVDLYAVWRSDVTVVYDANGGNLGQGNTVDQVDIEKGNYTVKTDKQVGFSTDSAVDFGGWSIDPDGKPVVSAKELPKEMTVEEIRDLAQEQIRLKEQAESTVPQSGIHNGDYILLSGSDALTVKATRVANDSLTSQADQRFHFLNRDNGYVRIAYGDEGLYLTGQDGKVSLSKWKGDDSQEWKYANGVLTAKNGSKWNATPKKITYGLEDGYYSFTSALSSKKSIDTGSDKYLQIYDSNDGLPQQFKVRNLHNGYASVYVMDYFNARHGYWTVENNSGEQYVKIKSEPSYTGKDGQMWRFVTIEGVGMFIENRLGTRLDVTGGSTNNSTDLQTHDGNNLNNQKFTANRLDPLESGVYRITMKQNQNAALAVKNGSYASNSTMVIGNNSLAEDAMYFRVTYLQGGYYRIDNVRSSLSLNVEDGSKDDGATLQQFPWKGSEDNEIFQLKENGDGSYDICAGKLGTYIGTKNTTAAGSAVSMYKARSAYTKWEFDRVGDENDHKILTLYAVWGDNEPPVIEAEDTWVFYEDIEDGTNAEKDYLEETILENATAEDDRDGNITDRIEIVDYEEVWEEAKKEYDKNDPNTEDLVKKIEITYTVSDDFGNTTEKKQNLYVVFEVPPLTKTESAHIRYVDKAHISTVDPSSNWGTAYNNQKLRKALDNLESGTNPVYEMTID